MEDAINHGRVVSSINLLSFPCRMAWEDSNIYRVGLCICIVHQISTIFVGPWETVQGAQESGFTLWATRLLASLRFEAAPEIRCAITFDRLLAQRQMVGQDWFESRGLRIRAQDWASIRPWVGCCCARIELPNINCGRYISISFENSLQIVNNKSLAFIDSPSTTTKIMQDVAISSPFICPIPMRAIPWVRAGLHVENACLHFPAQLSLGYR